MDGLTEYPIFRAVEDTVLLEISIGQPGFRKELDDATKLIRNGYSPASLANGAATGLPFSNAALRWAYVYRFATSHTYVVLRALNRFWDTAALQPWLDTLRGQQLRVCCVGGGPGTDFIGIALFIQQHRLDITKIHGDVLDRWTEWQPNFRSLSGQLQTPHLGKVNYWHFDFNQPCSWHYLQNICNADLVTMIKLASAVAADPTKFQVQLAAVLTQMKYGAMLLVVDNDNSKLFELVCQAAADAGLHALGEVHYTNKLPQREKTAIESSQLQLGGLKSQKSAVVSAVLWKKQISLDTNTGNSTKMDYLNSAVEVNVVQCKIKNNNTSPHLNNSYAGMNLASGSCNDHHVALPKWILPQATHPLPPTVPPASSSNVAKPKKHNKKSTDVCIQTIPLEVFLAQIRELWAASRDEQSTTANSNQATSTSLPAQFVAATKQLDPPGEKETEILKLAALSTENILPTTINKAAASQSSILTHSLINPSDAQDDFTKTNKQEQTVSDVTSAHKPVKKGRKKKSKTVTAVSIALLQEAPLNPWKVPLNHGHAQGENVKKVAMRDDECGATFNCQSQQSPFMSNVYPEHAQNTVTAGDLARHCSASTTTLPAIMGSIPADTNSGQTTISFLSSNSMEEFMRVTKVPQLLRHRPFHSGWEFHYLQ